MMATGMLGEGKISDMLVQAQSLPRTDGIHIDMNHLKKGEVKYEDPDSDSLTCTNADVRE
jgi:hypothetical protein